MHRPLAVNTALASLALLAGCGGGGGTVSTPAPVPTPSPAPAPAPGPTTTPAATFDTAELRRSDGPGFHNTVTAWQRGVTGRGVTIGIVDSGIDTTNPEFTGRISSASADVAGSRSIEAEDDHGTQVALVAAAARNDSGVVGIAYQSTIMALRADTPGSCSSPPDGCTFGQSAIAAGIDRAAQNGAKVINLSLGGGAPTPSLGAALGRAAAADVVVVVAAGNVDTSDPSADPNNPDPLAAGLRAAGNGNVIIVGSVDETGAFSTFAHRAGTEAGWFLSALGERICCVYENGVIKTTISNGQQLVEVVSGTSFATPQVSAAIALLRQAFPNLTAAQTVDLLLRSARDAGAAGTDAVYGRGILDIANAFAPLGTTTIAGTSQVLALTESMGTMSPAMGDAAQSIALQTVVLDDYGRAYGVDLGSSLRRAGVAPRLASALVRRAHEISAGGPALSLAFSVNGANRTAIPSALRLSRADADSARVLAARAITQVTPETRMGFAYAENADGLAAALQDGNRPTFLLAGSPLSDSGFARDEELSFGMRRQLGAWGLTISAERALVRDDRGRSAGDRRRQHAAIGTANRLGARIDRSFGQLDLGLGASWLGEEQTFLGASFNPSLVGRGADSIFVDLDAAWRPGDAWRLGGALRRTWTRPRGGGLLATGTQVIAQSWSFDVARSGFFTAEDGIAFRLAQPLRVVAGGLDFDLPTDYDYATLTATRSRAHLSLVPRGREMLGEVAWRGALWGGSASASLFYRKDPGHYAALPDEKGVAISWSGEF